MEYNIEEAVGNIIAKGVAGKSIKTDPKDIAQALNFGKYPVLTYDLDEEKGGSKARVTKMSQRHGLMTYNCMLFMGSETYNDGAFYLMTGASMVKGSYDVYDYLESAEYTNAPIIEDNQEVAILVHSRERNISFVIIAKSGKVDPSYSTATDFKY